MVEPLHVDEKDGCIVLYRMEGDCWRVARDQAECDHFRNYEVQSPGLRRFGLTGLKGTTPFVRVQRIEEEPIEPPPSEPSLNCSGEQHDLCDLPDCSCRCHERLTVGEGK